MRASNANIMPNIASSRSRPNTLAKSIDRCRRSGSGSTPRASSPSSTKCSKSRNASTACWTKSRSDPPRCRKSSTHFKMAAPSSAATLSNKASQRSGRASPAIISKSSKVGVPSATAKTWSNIDSASRKPPRQPREIAPKTSAGTCCFSHSQMDVNLLWMSTSRRRRNSKTWQRETIVSGILCGSVVANRNSA